MRPIELPCSRSVPSSSTRPIELPPANSYVRRVQHQLATRYNLDSRSAGKEPNRRVRILPTSG